MTVCSNDYQFGPGANCRTLDFTILFSNIFLSFVPALVFTCFAIPRIYHLGRKQRKLLPWKAVSLKGWTILLIRSLSSALVLGASIALAAMQHTGWSITAANVLGIIASVLLSAMVMLETLRCARASQLAALYPVAMMLLLASRIRTFALVGAPNHSIIALAVMLAGYSILFAALQFSDRSSLENGHSLPPGATSGIVSRYFVAWVLPLLIRGYRTPLDLDSLGSIDKSLWSEATWETFQPEWKWQSQQFVTGHTKQPLLRACGMAFLGTLSAPLLPSLIYSVVSMARPLILLETVNFVSSYQTPYPENVSDGWGLVGATILVYGVYSLSLTLAHIATKRASLAIRGALMEALYHKALVIRTETARELGAKSGNLMSVDIRLIVEAIQALHEMWTALVQTGLGLYIIYTQVGLSFLAAVGGAILFFAVLPFITREIGPARTRWAERTDKRVKFMASVLRHMKAIKLSAYEPIVFKKGIEMREFEMQGLIGWVKEILSVSLLTNMLGNLLCVITIITFSVVSLYTANTNDGVTTAKIFAVVSTITIISTPLLLLGQRLGSLLSAWASFKRIERFLLEGERIGAGEQDEDDERDPKDPESAHNAWVKFDHATFGVQESGLKILKSLDIQVEKPELWMIVGRVGSGKSTLLQSILGEVDLLSGSSNVRLGTIGFCSQDPWLRINSSIRDNITFMKPYNSTWYHRVIKATALDVDFKQLAGADRSVVGNLSGGQKQRVALARALYMQCNTLILDDVFSALDADTEELVFNGLFGKNGLLNGKSVILATNQVHRLPHSSLITALRDGAIAEQGTYAELVAAGNETARLVQEFAAGAANKTLSTKADNDALAEPQSKAGTSMVEEATEREGRQGAVSWSTYLVYLRAMGWVVATTWLGAVVAAAAIEVSINVFLQAFTNRLTGAPASLYAAFLGGYTGIQVGYFVAFCIGIWNAFLYAHPMASRRLHQWQLSGLLKTSISFFETRAVGQMINRDLNIIDLEMPNYVVNFMFAGTRIVGSFLLMIVTSYYMTAVIGVTVGIMVLLQRFYVRAGRELRRLDLTTKSPIYTMFTETMDPDGLRTIRAMKANQGCLESMTEHITASQHPAWLLPVVQKWLELALDVCVTVINTALVLIAVIGREKISPGILAVALSQAAAISTDLSQAVVQWTMVETCVTSVERVQEYIELPPQKEKNASSKLVVGSDWLQRGSIVFNNATARYASDLPPAMCALNLNIKPGQRVGICGRSGSGKSTLLGALWRLIDMDDDGGHIMIDGVDIRDVPLHDYRDSLSIIPQDPLLLELSLRENLDPAGECSDQEIWAALEQSQLKSHIENLPGKLDELMAGDGGSFSRGQRQLLALARAILRNRRILALDEATSSIDMKTDAAIQQTIRTAFGGCTVLTIAHRISTVIDYDVIVVMDAGRIVEMGSPAELLGMSRGHFRRLAVENGAVESSHPVLD